jgi:2-beta-glucuronyltransferase
MPGTAILFTQQTIGLGARKTSMIFLAEAYRDLGYDVHVVTCQLSRLTRLKKPNKLEALPADRLNRWYDADGMHGYIWVAPVHPATLHPALDGIAGPLLAKAYGASMPRDIRDRVAAAELVVVESCAAIALFDRIRRIAPRATSVYSMSDRLLPVGMHPVLQTILERDARHYSVVRTPARAMLADLPGANAVHIRHGLDKALFAGEHPSPFASGPNAVLVGDMMLDRTLLGSLVAAHPGVAFHYFGRTALDVGDHPNLIEHGEVPFAALVPYLAHADVGLSLYRQVDDLDYLAESSLKNIQYEYCGLPIVAPYFVAQGAARVHGYTPGDPASASSALTAALAAPRGRLGEADVADWREVAEAILAAAR